jgi:hypothetical protein
MRRYISKNIEKEILDLFFCSDDNRVQSIANVFNFSFVAVTKVINKYFYGQIKYKKPDYKIYHSKMNYENRM